jgi:hypothetical protein
LGIYLPLPFFFAFGGGGGGSCVKPVIGFVFAMAISLLTCIAAEPVRALAAD